MLSKTVDVFILSVKRCLYIQLILTQTRLLEFCVMGKFSSVSTPASESNYFLTEPELILTKGPWSAKPHRNQFGGNAVAGSQA